MSYKSIIVHLQLGQTHDCLLNLAGELADRFDARLIGVAATLPVQLIFGGGDGTGEFLNEDNEEISREMVQVETRFRSQFAHRATRVGWESIMGASSIAEYVATVARSADLLLTSSPHAAIFDSQRHMNIEQLVLHAGRPILIMPPEPISLQLNHLLVAWDDSREARRAIADALPLLKQAKQVTVLHLIDGAPGEAIEGSLHKVIEWLSLHDIPATALFSKPVHSNARELDAIALANAYDLVIAGAYGHSRFREWLTGGLTHALVHPEQYCTFLSH